MNDELRKARTFTTVEALQALAQSHDPEAWAALLHQHGGMIMRTARGIVREVALAEDVCQETLLQLRDNAGQFRPPAHEAEAAARAWIVRIACTTALMLLRARRRIQSHEESCVQQAVRTS